MRQFIVKYKLALLFIFAFLIRLINLDQSLWLDEATTAIAVQTHSFWNIVTQFSPADFHPPFYYLFMDLWTNVFGYSEIALRMPSVLFSLGAGLFVYNILRVMTNVQSPISNERCAFWSAAFFLLNPLIVYYSQEARMYSMVTFFIAASFYYLVKITNVQLPACRQARRITNIKTDVFLMSVFLVLSFYTFYASAFYIAAVYLFMFMSSSGLTRGSRLLSWIPAFLPAGRHGAGMTMRSTVSSILVFIIALLPLSPLLLTQLANSRVALEQVTNWSMVLGNVSLKNILLIPLKFTSGRISFEPKMLYYLLSGVWMMVVFGIVALGLWDSRLRGNDKKGRDRSVQPGMTILLLYFLLFPLMLGAIFSTYSPLLQYFRFQYLIVFLSMMLGFSLASIPDFSLRWVPALRHAQGIPSRSKLVSSAFFGVLFSCILATWSLLYLLVPQFHREDWKSLASAIQSEDLPVYMILSSSDPLKYYSPAVEVRGLRGLSVMDSGMTSNTIIVIPHTADIHGVMYNQGLEEQGFQLSQQYSARQVVYEKWDRK